MPIWCGRAIRDGVTLMMMYFQCSVLVLDIYTFSFFFLSYLISILLQLFDICLLHPSICPSVFLYLSLLLSCGCLYICQSVSWLVYLSNRMMLVNHMNTEGNTRDVFFSFLCQHLDFIQPFSSFMR